MYYVHVSQKKKHTQLIKEIHIYVHNDITESMIPKLREG